MSQQINLLVREQSPVGSALWALAAVALAFFGLLAYDSMLRSDNNQLQRDADLGQHELAQVKASLEAMRQSADSGNDAAALKAEIDALKAEIDALKPRADAVRQLLEVMTNGSLGSPDGFAQHLSALASVSEEGLWLTSVSVGSAGKLVSLSGRALRNESVLRYAKRLNEAFAPQGVQFNSVEMTPESLVKTGDAGKPPLSTVAFRLL